MTKRILVLIAEAETEMAERLGASAARMPADVRLAATGNDAVEMAQLSRPHVIIANIELGDMRAAELIARLRPHLPTTPVIVVTSDANVTRAVEVMRAGAFTVLEHPLDSDAVLAAVRNAADEYRLRNQLSDRGADKGADAALGAIVGRARALTAMLDVLRTVAPSDANCLILGENGTGKELVADAIHAGSHRAAGPLIKINCAAIPEELLESELFGHRRGAFTGAVSDRDGLFHSANGGSLFLDEIAEMPPFLQAKLLRVLQEREFRPVGATRGIPLDARLICATNVNVTEAVRASRLRQDLLFRINTITLQVPALRDRLDDLPLLCSHLLQRLAARHARVLPGVSAAALHAMSRYHWPGNVRELENVLERAVLLTTNALIDLPALPMEIRCPIGRGGECLPTLMTLDQIERRALLEALERSNWNKQVAAASLGIYRPTLYSKMRKFAIRDPHRAATAR